MYHYTNLTDKVQNRNSSPKGEYYSSQYMQPVFKPRHVSEAIKVVPYL